MTPQTDFCINRRMWLEEPHWHLVAVCNRETSCNPNVIFLPAVPRVLFTSPGMVWVLFLNLTEQPKSPSLIRPDDVRKMLAPDN